MKRKFLKRALLGFSLGLALYLATSIGYSLAVHDGMLHMTDIELVTFWGNELNSVIYHAVYMGFFMSWVFVARLVWDIESWGILKRNLVVYTIFGLFLIPNNLFISILKGSYTFFVFFTSAFLIVCAASFLTQYLTLRKKVKEMNGKIQDNQQS